MTIKESFHQFLRQLASLYSDREARHIAHMVFEKVTKFTVLDILTKADTLLPLIQQKELDEKLHQLLDNMPVQYVTGEAWFYKLKFHVNEHVLIPRPETEELISWIIEDLKKEGICSLNVPAYPFTMLDIGTGSGCIAIALKKNIPGINMIALDKSAQAIQVARENAAMHHATIRFIQSDILGPNVCSKLPVIDLLVSNPPYIPSKEKDEMQPQVANYEPSMALFVPDNDPLQFYKALLEVARQKLVNNGLVYTETHEDFGAEVCDLFHKYGFKKAILRKDINGHDRMVCGKKQVR